MRSVDQQSGATASTSEMLIPEMVDIPAGMYLMGQDDGIRYAFRSCSLAGSK